MKKILVAVIILLLVNPLYSQDFIKEYNKLLLVNESLQKQVTLLNSTINELKNSNDSLVNTKQVQIKTLENEQIDLNEQIKSYESTIDDLNKNKIKNERDHLQSSLDSLLKLNGELANTISDQNSKKIQAQKSCDETKRQEYDKGKLELINQLAEFYNKPFDDLITSSSIKIVERDFPIVGNKVEFEKKLRDLKKYFIAEQVLHEKFNEQNVSNAITIIGNIDKTESVRNLDERLKKYKLYLDGLNKALSKILEIDKKFIGVDNKSIEVKTKNILFELSYYFRNYRFNFKDYPYLTEIILDIIKLKQEDPNADIKYLIDKL
jgi:hypothetical protein